MEDKLKQQIKESLDDSTFLNVYANEELREKIKKRSRTPQRRFTFGSKFFKRTFHVGLSVLTLCLVFLIFSSYALKENPFNFITGSKYSYPIEDAKANGDIVIVYEGKKLINFSQPEAYNIERFAEFQRHVDNKEADALQLTIYDGNGYAESTLFTKNGQLIFTNNYEGFPDSITGRFTCRYLTVIDGAVNLEMCKKDSGEQYNRIFAFNFDSKYMTRYGIHW